MQGILSNVQNQLMALGTTVAIIGVIILGLIAVISGEKGLRKLLSGAGGVVAGIICIGAGAAIVGAIMSFAKSL